ncbi:MAG: hypothetical protein ACYTF1_02540 [Planctomycetota bacterium]
MCTKPDIKAFRECIKRVVDWFLPMVTTSGTIRDESDILAYYHAPNLLAVTGAFTEANRMANWLAKEVLTAEGDFRYRGAKGEIIKPSLQWNYLNGWMTWGLARLGRFDLSEPAAKYIEKFQDPATGGFFTAADPENDFSPVSKAVDMGSTCASSLAMVYTGRWSKAIKAGEFLIKAIDKQPQSNEAFFCMFANNGQAVTGFPEDQNYANVIRFDQPMQAYWYFGFAARILILLFRATGRKDLMDGALGYIDLFERCHEDRWEHWANDKVAWASAALYQITGDRKHLERVARCFNPIVEQQRDDAVWHWKAFYPDYEKQPSSITTELALEFAYLLHEIVGEIESV